MARSGRGIPQPRCQRRRKLAMERCEDGRIMTAALLRTALLEVPDGTLVGLKLLVTTPPPALCSGPAARSVPLDDAGDCGDAEGRQQPA